MNSNPPQPDLSGGVSRRPAAPAAPDNGSVPEPDDSGLGEEDPGAALDDPAVREALQHEVQPADRRDRRDGRSGR